MENKNQPQTAGSDVIEIKAINEDDYWAKEFDIPADQLKKHDANIYDLIVDAHIKTQKSGS